jgi:hypothetical protein
MPCAEIGHPILLVPFNDCAAPTGDDKSTDKATGDNGSKGVAAGGGRKKNDKRPTKPKVVSRFMLAVTLRPSPLPPQPPQHPAAQQASGILLLEAMDGGGDEKKGEPRSQQAAAAVAASTVFPPVGASKRAAALGANAGDHALLAMCGRELGKALGFTRGREARAEGRRVAAEAARRLCEGWASGAGQREDHLAVGVLGLLKPHLRGASLYVGLVEPGGHVMRFGPCSANSGMAGQVLSRSKHPLGVSFEAVDSKRPLVVKRPRDYYPEGSFELNPYAAASAAASTADGGASIGTLDRALSVKVGRRRQSK